MRHYTLSVSELDPHRSGRLSAVFATEVVVGAARSGPADEIGGGAVTAVHRRTPSARDATIHLLALDGVYASSATGRVFRPHRAPPSPASIDALARRLGDGLAPSRLSHRVTAGPLVSLHADAGPAIDGEDRERRRDLVRLLARAPTRDRADSVGPRLRHRLAHPFSDGTTHVEIDALDLGRQLRQLVPTVGPVAYHGVLAAPAAARWRVLGRPTPLPARACPACPGLGRIVQFEETRAEAPQLAVERTRCGG